MILGCSVGQTIQSMWMLSPCGWTLFCTSSIRMEKTREREFMRSRAIFVPFSADDHQSIQHVSLSIETFPHLSPSSHSLHSFTSDALSSVASSNQYSFQCYRETEKEEECSLLVSHGQCEISFNGNLNKIDRSKKNKYDIWMSRRVSSIDRCRHRIHPLNNHSPFQLIGLKPLRLIMLQFD